MTFLRNTLCLATAILLATFALSSGADPGKKQYSLAMAIASAPPTPPPFTVTATVTNKGNSTINSFSLSVLGMTIVGVDPPASGTAAGPFPGSSVSVTHMHPLKSGDSLTLTLQVSSCGDGMWSAVVWNGSSLNGQSFNLVPAASTLTTSIACAAVASGVNFVVPDSLNPNCVLGRRGYYDKDGSAPTGNVPIFVTNTVFLVDNQLHFRWPDFQAGGDPLATFEYTVCGPGELPDLTYVAWLNTDGSPASTPGTPAYIVAEDCLENANFLPAPYGTLTANVGLNDTLIAVDTTTPPRQSPPGSPPGSIPYPGSAPVNPTTPGTAFDIVIRTEPIGTEPIGTERITVQVVCLDNDGDPSDTSDCTEAGEGEALAVVQRGVGGTTATTHLAGSLVMSTPLPPLPAGVAAPYTPGNQALMCISSQQGEGEGGVHSTTFIDIGGDGWANHP